MANSKTVLITGASSGFGLLTAKTLLSKGHTVIATMRDITGRNAAIYKELKQLASTGGGTLEGVELDVGNDKSVTSALQKVLGKHNEIDVVVNNAGVAGGGMTEAFSTDQCQQIFNINVLGPQRIMREVLPTMRQHGNGLVINVSSIMGRMVIPFAGAYTASKYALEGLMETYRYELAGTGVDVVIVEPGAFPTGIMDHMIQAEDQACSSSYGPVAEIANEMWSGMSEQVQSNDGPNPQEVADAISTLIDTPAGSRPLRTVVDPMMGGQAPQQINEHTDAVEKEMLGMFGMTDLLSVKV